MICCLPHPPTHPPLPSSPSFSHCSFCSSSTYSSYSFASSFFCFLLPLPIPTITFCSSFSSSTLHFSSSFCCCYCSSFTSFCFLYTSSSSYTRYNPKEVSEMPHKYLHLQISCIIYYLFLWEIKSKLKVSEDLYDVM